MSLSVRFLVLAAMTAAMLAVPLSAAHYRASVLGRCITYSASVVGQVSFDYS
jgi:hypothetical protein